MGSETDIKNYTYSSKIYRKYDILYIWRLKFMKLEIIKNLPQCNKNMFLDEDAYHTIEENDKNKIFSYEPSKLLKIKYNKQDMSRE